MSGTEWLDALGRKIEAMAEVVDRQQGILHGILAVLSQLTERMDTLTVRVDTLTVKVDALAIQVEALATKIDKLADVGKNIFDSSAESGHDGLSLCPPKLNFNCTIPPSRISWLVTP